MPAGGLDLTISGAMKPGVPQNSGPFRSGCWLFPTPRARTASHDRDAQSGRHRNDEFHTQRTALQNQRSRTTTFTKNPNKKRREVRSTRPREDTTRKTTEMRGNDRAATRRARHGMRPHTSQRSLHVPKSMSTRWPDAESIMFSGLRSRCAIPRPWTCSSATTASARRHTRARGARQQKTRAHQKACARASERTCDRS